MAATSSVVRAVPGTETSILSTLVQIPIREGETWGDQGTFSSTSEQGVLEPGLGLGSVAPSSGLSLTLLRGLLRKINQ